MNPLAKGNCFITAGVVIGLICVVFMASFNVIFTSVLNNMLVIDPDNAIIDTFTHPTDTVPIYLNFNLFHVVNPDDVEKRGAKPILDERGPYVYQEFFEKTDYVWHDEDGTVEYRDSTTYVFNAELSNGTEDDKITALNPVMVIVAALAYNQPGIKVIWKEIEKEMDLFEEHTVGEWIFKGYELPKFNFKSLKLNGTLYDISCQLNHCVPQLKSNRFGYFYGSNGTDDGVYRVYTGKKGMDNYLYVKEWNYDTRLHYWGEKGKGRDKYCNMINGTDGTQFPPGVSKDQIIPIFVTDLCRSISFNYEKEIVVQDEITCYRFLLPRETLQSGDTNPANQCYCIPLPDDDDDDGCLDDAMLNLAPCMFGAPIVLSTPHFYQGNQTDIDSFIGLEPQPKLHETFLDIEPTTGVVMQAAKRIQLNLPLKQYDGISTFKNVPEVIFPAMWFDENAVISEDDAKSAHFLLNGLFVVVYVLLALLLLAGLALIGWGISRMYNNDTIEVIEKSETETRDAREIF